MDRPMKCPLCGSEASVSATFVERGWWCAEVSCNDDNGTGCGMQTLCGAPTKDVAVRKATEAWNLRQE